MADKTRLTDQQWKEVQEEWELGQLDITMIASRYGIDRSAVTKRATRKGWPPRGSAPGVVRGLVTRDVTRDLIASPVTNHRSALMAFHRAMELLVSHRADIRALRLMMGQSLERARAIVDRRAAQNRPLTLKEEAIVMGLFRDCANALARLIPLERRAFGYTDQDGPSELDALTEEEQEALLNTLNRALGRDPDKLGR